mgnify:CR=1 FL=1
MILSTVAENKWRWLDSDVLSAIKKMSPRSKSSTFLIRVDLPIRLRP